MTRVAFVGLGAMGLPMARNLLERQFRVAGFDMRASALDELAAAGGTRAASAAEAARGADALLLMVVDAAQAENVLFEAGAAAALARGAVVVLMATCAPAAARALALRCEALSLRFLDAPVSGGVVGARAASLTIMCAGAPEAFAAARPLLDAMGGKIFHVGEEPGQGATVKIVNQLLCGVHIAAAAEALTMARKAGLDGAKMLEILGGAAAASWMLANRGPRMLDADPQVTSAVDIFVKDLGLVLDAGRGARMALPLAAQAHQMFLAASGMGLGAKDDSQVIAAYRALAGLPRE